MSIPTRPDVDRIVREKAATDPAFRKALLADPRAAVGEAIGVPIPEYVTVTVHEESLTEVHLVIPAAVGDEVAEEDLVLVAGAGCWGDECDGGTCGSCGCGGGFLPGPG